MKVGIIGATGYAGQELVRLLLQHPKVDLAWVTSNTYKGQPFDRSYGNFVKIFEEECIEQHIEELSQGVDAIFLATPHGLSASLVHEALLNKVVIIDLSADFRMKDENIYAEWYGEKHSKPHLLNTAVYGLCELYRDRIKETKLVANPGCYPTATTLGLYPLLKEKLIDTKSIIVDAKSGVSGAGRSLKIGSHYNEVNESTKAYGIGVHRHTPEIEEQLSRVADEAIIINFTPHLIPMHRGILITAYANLKDTYQYEYIQDIYKSYYKDEYFVRLLNEGNYPETRWVKGSNFCDINFKIDPRTNRIIVVSAIDNLIKGAAGQAVQNMNIIFGFDEELGLMQVPMFP
jgi:N-acetyl-gamma-glutamyl-phosphate reductase